MTATRLAQRYELGFDLALAAALATQALDRQFDRILLTEALHQLADRQRCHVPATLAYGHAHKPARGDNPDPEATIAAAHDPLWLFSICSTNETDPCQTSETTDAG